MERLFACWGVSDQRLQQTVQHIADEFLQSSLVCSPDGKHLGVLGNKSGDQFSLYVMKPDGTNLQRLKKLSNNAAGGTYGFIFSFWM